MNNWFYPNSLQYPTTSPSWHPITITLKDTQRTNANCTDKETFKSQSDEQEHDTKLEVGPYFGGLKDSPTCRHNLHEVTYS